MSTTNFVDLHRDNYDYILLGCGYIERLECKVKEIIETTQYKIQTSAGIPMMVHDLVSFIYFSSWHVSVVQRSQDKVPSSTIEAQRTIDFHLRDSVCIRVSSHSDELEQHIKSRHHCGFFDEHSQPQHVASFTTSTGKKVLYLGFDTESVDSKFVETENKEEDKNE
jgi:hypothetical protein